MREGARASEPGFHIVPPVLKHRAAPSGGKGCWEAREEREKGGANKRGKRNKCRTKNDGGRREPRTHFKVLAAWFYAQMQLTKVGKETKKDVISKGDSP